MIAVSFVLLFNLQGAARWKNAYLLKQQERFLSENGGADYLNGFTQLPKKLAMLLGMLAIWIDSDRSRGIWLIIRIQCQNG